MVDAAASNRDGVFGEIHVFLQLKLIGLFGADRAYLHFEFHELQEVFLSKLTQFSQRKIVLYASAFNTDV